MYNQDIGPTSLSTIRDFLRAERREPPPWAPPTRAVDELYALLRERRDDDLFWARLRDLATRLEDQRFSSDALARAEAIEGTTVDRLIDHLRASLDGDEDRSRTLKDWLGAAISKTALAGFVILGAAASCADDGLCKQAVEQKIKGDEGTVYCDLIDIINDADLSASAKQDLLDCLPDLDAEYREWLLQHFESLTMEQIADFLAEMVGPYGVCNGGWDTDSDTH